MASRKNRTTLGAIAFILLLGLTFVALDQRDKPSGEDSQLPVVSMPQSSITEVQVTRPGEKTTVMRKVDGDWVITAPLEAEADGSAVNTAIRKLSETSVKSIVATKPEHYSRLEVDPDKAVHVAVRHSSGEMTELDLGKYANGYTMARVNDSEAVYGLDGEFLPSLDRELDKWRDTKIVGRNPASIIEITYDTDRGRYSFVRDLEVTDRMAWKQAQGEPPIEKLDERRVPGLVSTVGNLRAVGFAGEDVTASEAGLDPPVGTITFTAQGGTHRTLRAEPEPADAEAENERQTIIVELGGPAKEDKRAYVRLQGGDTIFVISDHTYNRLRPGLKFFQEKEQMEPSEPRMPPQAQRP